MQLHHCFSTLNQCTLLERSAANLGKSHLVAPGFYRLRSAKALMLYLWRIIENANATEEKLLSLRFPNEKNLLQLT